MTADALGMVTADVTPAAAGAVTLQAAVGGGTVSSTFTAVDATRGLTLGRSVEYVAPGAAVAWVPAAWVFDRGTPAAGATVQWTVDQPGGIVFPVPSTVTDGQRSTSDQSTIGPLTAGVTANGQACAWSSVCAPLSGFAVDPARWRIVVVSGAGQQVAAASTLQPVHARVVDDAGHWIAGAVVGVHQVVDGWVECPPPVDARSPSACGGVHHRHLRCRRPLHGCSPRTSSGGDRSPGHHANRLRRGAQRLCRHYPGKLALSLIR